MTDPLTVWRAAAWAEPPQRVHQAPTAEMGMDLSEQLARYIDGSNGHFPVHDALLRYEEVCRRRHRGWWDHPNGKPTCYEIARAVIEYRTGLEWAAEHIADISVPRAERHLWAVVRWMRAKQERWLSDTPLSAGHDPEYCAECRRMAG